MMQHTNSSKRFKILVSEWCSILALAMLCLSFPAHTSLAQGCSTGFKFEQQPDGTYACVSQAAKWKDTSQTANDPSLSARTSDYAGYGPDRGNAPRPAGLGGNSSTGIGGNTETGIGGNQTRTGGSRGRANGCGGASAAGELVNPLKYCNITQFLEALIQILIIFALPLIILMIIYAGFMYVLARGNQENVTKATRILTYAIVGGLLILGADLLMKVIQGTVNQLTG